MTTQLTNQEQIFIENYLNQFKDSKNYKEIALI